MAKSPNILYSANSVLAHRISKEFYEDLHYVWCSTKFGSNHDDGLFANPSSSKPLVRFNALKVDSGPNPDGHSAIIASQKVGLKKGAEVKYKTKTISKSQRNEIFQIVDGAANADFAPLMYVIPFSKVARIAKKVDVKLRAHPLSDEWIIEELPGDSFDAISF